MLPIFAFLALAAAAAAADDQDLVTQLITANTQVNRIKDIANDSAFVFDFLSQARTGGQGGFAIGANSANFPALLTGRGAMTVGVMGPCGANSPHTHPRATEVQIVVQGGPIEAQFIQENGARAVSNTVPLGSATVFPEGSMHFQQNLGCDPTVFIASFDNVDPGTLSIAPNFLALDQGVVNATLGDLGAISFDLPLPANFILGAQSCLDRCGIDRSSFNFSSGNFSDFAIFSNSVWAIPANTSSSYMDSYSSSDNSSGPDNSSSPDNSGSPDNSSSPGAKVAISTLADGSVDVPFGKNPLRNVVIGLGTVAAALLVAVIGLVIRLLSHRRSGVRVSPRFVGGGAVGGQTYAYATPYDSEAESLRRSTDKQ